MARGVNKVILIGNCGNDPEIRYMPSGGAVANFSIATSEKWKDKQTGESKEKTEWHRVVFFGKLAEIIEQYVHKGTKVYVEGKLQTRKWQDKGGTDHYTTEIIGGQMQLLGSKQGDSGYPAQSAQNPRQQSHSPQASMPMDDGFDDDIPF